MYKFLYISTIIIIIIIIILLLSLSSAVTKISLCVG